MAKLIWDKGGSAVDERIQRFVAGDDVIHDRALFLYDVHASRAHVHGLARIGVLPAEEADALTRELDALAEAFASGAFVLDERFEDGHSAIEVYLVERLGDTGRKVHTGRSRNDQVLVAMRLYLRDALGQVEQHVLAAAAAFLDRAEADLDAPMPGYTHLQRAVPSSVGLWLAGFAEAMIDNAELARSTAAWVDCCPLGTAAGYGVNLPLDRQGVSDELGFSRLQINPVYAQNSRGKLEIQALMALLQPLFDVRRFAWDLSLYTTAEFGFVRLPDAFTTGSSIMPNKKNPDVIELLRASPAVVQGALAEVMAILSLSSGYHRDLQATKAPVLRAMSSGLVSLSLIGELVHKLSFDKERMAAAISPDMYATDRAVELALEGVPFRTAYQKVAEELPALAGRRPEDSLAARVSPGGTGKLMLAELRERLREAEARAQIEPARARQAITRMSARRAP
jgi:argininosuccinate lyase